MSSRRVSYNFNRARRDAMSRRLPTITTAVLEAAGIVVEYQKGEITFDGRTVKVGRKVTRREALQIVRQKRMQIVS